MPFLNRIQRWADDRPDDTAVVVAGRHLSWAALRDAAAARIPGAGAVTVLAEANSVDFAVSFAAAVAGDRQCAVLDPTWPGQLKADIAARLDATVVTPMPAQPEVAPAKPARLYPRNSMTGHRKLPS